MERRETDRRYREKNRERLRELQRARNANPNIRELNMQQKRARLSVNSLFKAAVQGNSNFVYPDCFNLGNLSVKCSYCDAVFFKNENKSSCCHNGKLSNLPTSTENFPFDIKQLFVGTDDKSKNFREFIRQYNNANAFCSMGANIEHMSGSVYSFKISGDVYHRSSVNIPIDFSLNSNNYQERGGDVSYAELFLYDTDTAVNIRMNNTANSKCKREIMSIISMVLQHVSPYASSYKRLREIYENEIADANRNCRPLNSVSLIFTRNLHDDQRVYNAPINSDDVALVFVSDREGNIPADIDFAVYPSNSRTLKRINSLSKHLDPMVFPLFFPNGEFGWTTDMHHSSEHSTAVRNKITTLQFYSYKIAVRRNVFNPLHYGGKLFQQYLVFAYARVEANRLNFIRHNQKALRVESYRGLLDYVNSDCLENNTRVGNIYILPSSFIGGPRFMSKLYQDNMAIVRKFGRPDLFITFTCNPAWEEIKSELKTFQNSSDRPDIVTRVFNLKLKEFLSDIVKKQIFGNIVSYVYVIEHQKRGLPHAHCLFTLAKEDKFKTGDDIDKIISAEIPNLNDNRQLHEVVLKHNVHGPCGEFNRNSVCMVNGKCSKQFPKEFFFETDISMESYPKYRRRPPSNLPEHFPRTRTNIPVDNRFIVPYNAYLSLKYNAHINVELCSTVKAIKYIHKYITKGHDCARVGVQINSLNNNSNQVEHDEISQYLNCRYISSQEAAWNLQELPIHGQSHNTVMLSVHLKDGQSVYFQENNIESALRRQSAACTTLTAFFELNLIDTDAHQFFYSDIPNHYVFKNSIWEKRSINSHFGGKTIGRIIAVSPRDIERYHLRLILLSVKGNESTSFEALKTFNNVIYLTYKEAARARGLINDSNEWENCLSEAREHMLPKSLRSLFVTILTHCNPADPLKLFNEFKSSMMEDFIHQGMNDSTAFSSCILDLKIQCEKVGFDFLSVVTIPNISEILNIAIAIILPPNIADNNFWEALNTDQLSAASAVFSSVLEVNPQKYFYLDGPGGSGKTFLYLALKQKISDSNKKVMCVAWTGIAANLLPDGTTCHSVFSLPLNMDVVKYPQISLKKKQFLSSIDCLIWDEAPMASGIALEIVDLVFRDIMNSDLPFGGKVVVLGGDFRQVLPVVRNGNRSSIVNATIKKSRLWRHFHPLYLKRNMRAISDPEFSEWLLNVGNGNQVSAELNKKTQYSCEVPNKYVSQDLIADVFGESFTTNDISSISQYAILCPKNDEVRELNEEVLEKLVSEKASYSSIDTVKTDDGTCDSDLQVNFPVEYLNSLNPSGLPPHILNLKKGCIVMLLRNLSIKNGLCNGVRMVVKDFSRNCIKAEIITGAHSGTVHFIPRISLNTANDLSLPFNFERHQFPVRLSYAMTINKSQGQTFKKVGLFLPQPCFTHGQLYTAFSRVTDSDALRVKVSETPRQGKTSTGVVVTDNVVYSEVFQ